MIAVISSNDQIFTMGKGEVLEWKSAWSSNLDWMEFFYSLKVNHYYSSEIAFEAERCQKGTGYALVIILERWRELAAEYWLAMAGEKNKEIYSFQ